jgi:hypothetical protein
MGNAPSAPSLEQVRKNLDPATNGLNDSIKKTGDDLNKSLADTKASIDKTNQDVANSVANTNAQIDASNKAIGDQLQTNLGATKSKLDNSLQATTDQLNLNLALTKQTIDYGKLQQATGIISQIASLNPVVYFALEGINAGTGGKSNQYLNNSESKNNPLFDSISNVLTGILGGSNDKQTEQPTYDYGTKLNPISSSSPPEPQPYAPDNGYSKYASLETSNQTISKSQQDGYNYQNLIIPTVIGAVVLGGFVYSTKKK